MVANVILRYNFFTGEEIDCLLLNIHWAIFQPYLGQEQVNKQ